MIAWARTKDGWALNLDGSDGAQAFALPRLELHAGAGGWTAVCHLPDGETRPVALGALPSALAAKRAAVESALRCLGPPWDAALRPLL
jgi:hypothetical protein